MSAGQIEARLVPGGHAVRLRWDRGVIIAIDSTPEAAPDLWLAPALFDLQINGYTGVDFQQDNVGLDDLLKAVRELRSAACPLFFVTLITDEWPRMLKRLQHFRRLRQQSPELRDAIAGWHIEGPFLSPETGFRGAHDPSFMRDPTADDIKLLRETAGGDSVLLTLAPERKDAIAAVEQAVGLGIRVSLGHTNAPIKRIDQAIKAGAGSYTHLGNGCPSELNRHDNILWRIFETERISVSLIPDLIHVSPSLFRIVHRLLGDERIFYVTDAMAAAGAPAGRYRLGPLELEVGDDEIVHLPGSPNFAGSALRPIDGVLRAALMLQCAWHRVWPCFSINPGRVAGIPNELKVGAPATFCVLEAVSEPLNIIHNLKVYVRGELMCEEEPATPTL